MKAAMTVELDEETLEALDSLAARTDRSRNALVSEALEGWLTVQSWHVAEIEAGVAEAEAGQFATDEEVAAVFAKYGVDTARR